MDKIIKSAEELLDFAKANPGVRRWFVSRVFEGADEESEHPPTPVLDLYFAPATRDLLRQLRKFTVPEAREFLLSQTADHLEWWDEEDFDILTHLSADDFRGVLNEYSSYPADQPIEEGMVFIEISKEGEVCFVQFSYQARSDSNKVLKRLLDEVSEGEEAEGGAGQS